jgi:hypothetical protein
MVAAPIVGAVDEDATDAHLAHLGEGDLQRTAVSFGWCAAWKRAGHAPYQRCLQGPVKLQSLGPWNARELLRVVVWKGDDTEAEPPSVRDASPSAEAV